MVRQHNRKKCCVDSDGVIYVLCDIDDALVASMVGNLTIPTECYDLGSFKETIALLFDLKVSFYTLFHGN
jgi:hypothetical protein